MALFRIKMSLLRTFWITLAVVCAGQAHGQNWAQDCRDKGGQVVDYRVSRIKDGATKADFEKAFALHLKWYREHGYNENKMMLGDAIEVDPNTKAMGPLTNEVVTLHLNAPAVLAEKRDAAWDEYQAAYRKISDLIVDKKICIRLAP